MKTKAGWLVWGIMAVLFCFPSNVSHAKGIESVQYYVNTSERMYEPRIYNGIMFTVRAFQKCVDQETEMVTYNRMVINVENDQDISENDERFCQVYFFDACGKEIYCLKTTIEMRLGGERICLMNFDSDVVMRAYDYSVEFYQYTDQKAEPSGDYLPPECSDTPKEYYYKIENRAADLYESRVCAGYKVTGKDFYVENGKSIFRAEILGEIDERQKHVIDVSFYDGAGRAVRIERKEIDDGQIVLTMPDEDFFYETVNWDIDVWTMEGCPPVKKAEKTEETEEEIPVCSRCEEYDASPETVVYGTILTVNSSPYLYTLHERCGWQVKITPGQEERLSALKCSYKLEYTGESEHFVMPNSVNLIFYQHTGDKMPYCGKQKILTSGREMEGEIWIGMTEYSYKVQVVYETYEYRNQRKETLKTEEKIVTENIDETVKKADAESKVNDSMPISQNRRTYSESRFFAPTVFAFVTKKGSVRLKWKRNSGVSKYRIYRAAKKEGKYKRVKTVSGKKNSYTDYNLVRGHRYYYKVLPIANGKSQKFSKSISCRIPYLIKPEFSVAKGIKQGKRYVEIKLQSYEGKFLQVFVKKRNGTYQKIKLKTRAIKGRQGVFRLLYHKQGMHLIFRIRTYQIIEGKKRYSSFSNSKQIKT